MNSVFVDRDAIARSISHVPPAHYIVKIQSFSSLAEIVEEKYESEEFDAGGYKWKLNLYPNGNKSKNVKDHISLYLSIAKTSSFSFGWEVYAIFRLFLLDQNNDQFLILQDAMGKERRFHGLKTEWGFDQFIPHKAFKDALNGYLVEDTCVFGVEVFVKEKNIGKGECLSMIKDSTSFMHVWKIENFSKFGTYQNDSEVFSGSNYKWTMSIYPKGDIHATGTHLSLFLKLVDPSFKIYAEFTLRILDQMGSKHKAATGKNWFQEGSSACWGWARFVEFSYLNKPDNGFLVNDVCVVEAEVTLLGICKAL